VFSNCQIYILTDRPVDRMGDAYGCTFADFVAKKSKTSVVGRVHSAVKFSSKSPTLQMLHLRHIFQHIIIFDPEHFVRVTRIQHV